VRLPSAYPREGKGAQMDENLEVRASYARQATEFCRVKSEFRRIVLSLDPWHVAPKTPIGI